MEEALENAISYAEKMIDDCIDHDAPIGLTRYWVGYLDGVKAIKRVFDSEKERDNAC